MTIKLPPRGQRSGPIYQSIANQIGSDIDAGRLKPGARLPTQRSLARHLRDLRVAGIVERAVYPETPPRVMYTITSLGKSLRPLLDEMCHWGKSHSAAMALKKLQSSDREREA